jgi:hypothetical protein
MDILANTNIQDDSDERTEVIHLIKDIQMKVAFMKDREPGDYAPTREEVSALDVLAFRIVRLITTRNCDAPGTAELVLIQDETSIRTRWWARFDGKHPLLDLSDGWSCALDHGEGFAMAWAIAAAAEKALDIAPS